MGTLLIKPKRYIVYVSPVHDGNTVDFVDSFEDFNEARSCLNHNIHWGHVVDNERNLIIYRTY